jgi:hypothetical protein
MYREAKCVEIDEHVCLQPFDHSNAPAGVVLNTPEADAYGDHLGGFIFGHDREGFDVRCEGAVHVCGHGGNSWSMAGSLEGGDLTLSPSILCRLGSSTVAECGFHGFVRDGKWVPA